MTDTATATLAGEAFGAARGAEQLGIVGILTLVIIGLVVALVLTLRAHTAQGVAFAAEMAKWSPHFTLMARRARIAEQKIQALDARFDAQSDAAPRSRRGDG